MEAPARGASLIDMLKVLRLFLAISVFDKTRDTGRLNLDGCKSNVQQLVFEPLEIFLSGASANVRQAA